MASSGDYSYQPTCYQLIQGAARLVSAIQTGETLPDDEFSDMLFALNGMVTAWQASGIHVWCEEDATLFLQAGQTSYQIGSGSPDRCTTSNAWLQTYLTATAAANATAIAVAATAGSSPLGGPALSVAVGDHVGVWLDSGVTYWTTVASIVSGTLNLNGTGLPSQASAGAQVVTYTSDLVRPLKMPSARRIQYGSPLGQQLIKTPMSIYARIDYANIPNPQAGMTGSGGTPTGIFFDPQLGFAVANIWPSPGNNQSAISMTVQRPLQDFLVQGNTADFPIEWSSALRFNLAVEIAPEYDVPAQRLEVIKTMAAEKYAMVSAWDREMESVYFGVEQFPAIRN